MTTRQSWPGESAPEGPEWAEIDPNFVALGGSRARETAREMGIVHDALALREKVSGLAGGQPAIRTRGCYLIVASFQTVDRARTRSADCKVIG